MEWLPPIYIICNPHFEQKRFQFQREHLSKRGIPSEKITCVFGPWGSEITSEEIFKVYDPFQERYGSSVVLSFKSAHLSKGEISLNMTFFNILNNIQKVESEYILVFESDVFLREDFLERLKNILDEAKQSEWDYISLGEGVGTRPPDVDRLASYYTPSKLYKSNNNQWVFRCTDSMLLRVSFLKKVFTTFLPFRECLDWELNFQWILHGGKTLWVDPPLVEPGSARGRNESYLPA